MEKLYILRSTDFSSFVNVDTIIYDEYTYEIAYISFISYHNIVKQFNREMFSNTNKKFGARLCTQDDSVFLYSKSQKYEIETNKLDNYAHCIAYAKDSIIYDSEGDEIATIYSFAKTKEELENETFKKIQKYSSIPIIDEWKNYLLDNLRKRQSTRNLKILSIKQDINMYCNVVYFTKSLIKDIIVRGLKQKEISIKNSNEPSKLLNKNIGLDSYLSLLGETLAQKIQDSFVPQFTPGKDNYCNILNNVDDYIYKESDIEIFEAQKSIIQSVTNNLDKNKSTFIVAEMGSGKTLMGETIPYIHFNKDNIKHKGFNCIVLCPSHLTDKWKREIQERVPNSKAYIVNNYIDMINLTAKLKNRNKIENSYVIVSKEKAKLGFDYKPSAVWSKTKNTFVCPCCGQVLHTTKKEKKREIKLKFTPFSMNKEMAFNTKCMNKIKVWDSEEKTYIEKPCKAKLWEPVNKNNCDNWVKLGSQGWILKEHIISETQYLLERNGNITNKEAALLKRLLPIYNNLVKGEEIESYKNSNRRYPISKYIKNHMKDVFDYCIIDEAHQYKGLSEQGFAMADIISSSKKAILLTGTLLNGYADGLYYLLWRTNSSLMAKEGFTFKDESLFAKTYGVYSNEKIFSVSNNYRSLKSSKEKRLPGVSPLVFAKFLLNNAVFLSLSDMLEGLPGYKEIPIPIDMDDDLKEAYTDFEESFSRFLQRNAYTSKKNFGSFLQNLSSYPDCPHIAYSIHDVDTNKLIYQPSKLEKETRNKEKALLELVKEKIENGEKVLVYYTYVNKTDIGNSLLKLFKDNNIVSYEMTSSTSPDKREEWVEKHLEKGMQVMICNPSLVETGLDLLDFTSIVFYQIGYNLFTMRQASRRSWRLSQDKDVSVYFMYYRDTIQEQTLSLMATKLQAAMTIEGKVTEEGLKAMSNNTDLLSQIADNVANGIKDTVNPKIFESSNFIKCSDRKNRAHKEYPKQFKMKMNDMGEKVYFEYNRIFDRKIIDIDEELLKNPISIFI